MGAGPLGVLGSIEGSWDGASLSREPGQAGNGVF
jgi:hypothetical protein